MEYYILPKVSYNNSVVVSGPKTNHHTAKNPLRMGSFTGTSASSRKPSFYGEEVDENSMSHINNVHQVLLEEKGKLEKRLSLVEALLSQRDVEMTEMKHSIEEKADMLERLQEDNKKLSTNVKVLKEKRDLGLKEIQKLRDRIELLKVHQAVPDSLNTSFSMSAMNDSMNLSQQEKGQVADLLQSIHFDLQKVYKEAVVLIPLEDHDKNLTLLSLERRINGIINLICDNLD